MYRNEIKNKYFPKIKTHEINSHCNQEQAKEQTENQNKKVTGIVSSKNN